ncbi:solute carrier family 23 member 2-like [Ruditapes philippinarum]|uniref:solute carrier family 23 member 2-like n=1 Tax=Ruditapes philippinarum TaxID=129788 RepID=UPI00295AC5EC|nr:solute carrier family 23 member 2-like [Ruditapes philippinarum]
MDRVNKENNSDDCHCADLSIDMSTIKTGTTNESERIKGDDTTNPLADDTEHFSADGTENPAADDIETEEFVDNPLLYNVNEVPPVAILFSVAMQNILLGLGGALTTAYVISDVICAAPDHPIRAKLFCTSLFMTGICTTLQPLIGIRLSIFQGVCSTFLIPLMAMRSDSRWQCDNLFRKGAGVASYNMSGSGNSSLLESSADDEMYFKLREMMGCLIYASLFEVFVGFTGIVGILLRFIGPLTISVVISLIGLSLYKIPMIYIRTHWGLSSVCIILIILFMLYFGRVAIPCPPFCASKKSKGNKVSIFQMFPILLGILITWLLCGILTASGVFPDDPDRLSYRARTDVRNEIIFASPWFYVPYPGQFGSPLFNSTIFVGFLSAVISSIMESIGDYYATAYVSRSPPPPTHAINRAILLEGLGSLISGTLGAGHATTSSTSHVSLIGISKVASRSCMITTGILCLALSLISKFGAVLSTMPDPAIGGAMFVTFGILGAIGIFSLRSVDLTSSRNLAVFGLSLYTGIVIPEWVERYPEAINTGNSTSDGIVKGMLGTPMFLGGLAAAILDNTIRGTKEERGFRSRHHDVGDKFYTISADDNYNLPYIATAIKAFPFFQKLPFIQKYE